MKRHTSRTHPVRSLIMPHRAHLETGRCMKTGGALCSRSAGPCAVRSEISNRNPQIANVETSRLAQPIFSSFMRKGLSRRVSLLLSSLKTWVQQR